jgi:hypothetical protein
MVGNFIPWVYQPGLYGKTRRGQSAGKHTPLAFGALTRQAGHALVGALWTGAHEWGGVAAKLIAGQINPVAIKFDRRRDDG